jgi:hypothetical protein
VRVAPSIDPSAGVNAARAAGGTTVRVGFAEDRRTAVGVVLDAADLDVRRVWRDRDTQPVVGVVPLPGVEPSFRADRASAGLLRERTTLPEIEPGVVVGLDDRGVSVVVGEQRAARSVWRTALDEAPRLFVGSGGQSAHVVVAAGNTADRFGAGWLGPRGEPRSRWHSTVLEAVERGAPALAVDGDGALCVVATRRNRSAAWSLTGLAAAWGGGFGPAAAIDLPETAAERTAPRVASSSRGRWLVQWTEGTSGSHDVRVVLLDDKLRRVTEPLVISPSDVNAGAGAIATLGGGALSLFLVRNDSAYELWATAVACN